MAKRVPNSQTGSLTDHRRGTDDTLVGVDSGPDILYGDAYDMFDRLRGVGAAVGRIDVSAYGFTSLTNMMVTFDGTSTKIAFDANDSVALTGFAGTLRAQDFVFA